jgi:uncharacterized protein (DUF927 family)
VSEGNAGLYCDTVAADLAGLALLDDPATSDASAAELTDTPAQAPVRPRPKAGGSPFVLLDGTETKGSAGVYFIGRDKEGNEKAPLWLCAPLHIRARTRGAKSTDWGLLLEWCDQDGHRHRWAMPSELLSGDGTDVRRELMRLGLATAPSRAAREQLNTYLQVWPVSERARCVERLGWLGPVYVLPDQAIGAESEAVVFQSAQAVEPAFSVAGTAADWRTHAAALAQGNSRLVFAVCCALAPPLADLAGEDSGGWHLRGKSSSGKSTALALAASVWGHPATYPRLWRTTANGLEGLASMHNDGLLILDELSQVDPREAGESAYLLANGQGKTRATRTGTARAAARWRLLFLSAGEESLSAMMNRAGKRANAGQEIRLADIEADAGAGLGAFEVLHGHPTGAGLALAIKDAATRHHGAVGVAWLRHVVSQRSALADDVPALVREFVDQHTDPSATGQVIRVARRFGLAAAAGELATGCGLTGWPDGEAFTAVGKCFAAWLAGFGGAGNREDRALLSQVRAFFEVHGASRFEDITSTVEVRIPNRAGFFRTGADGARQFLVLPEVFRREVCAGFDPKAAALVLVQAGVILAGKDGKASRSERLPGIGATSRVYVFGATLWEGDE